MRENLPYGGWIRQGGHLQPHPLGSAATTITFPDGPCRIRPFPTGDLEAAFQATGAADIIAYSAELDPAAAKPRTRDPQGAGPQAYRSFGWARATGPDGATAQAWLQTGEPTPSPPPPASAPSRKPSTRSPRGRCQPRRGVRRGLRPHHPRHHPDRHHPSRSGGRPPIGPGGRHARQAIPRPHPLPSPCAHSFPVERLPPASARRDGRPRSPRPEESMDNAARTRQRVLALSLPRRRGALHKCRGIKPQRHRPGDTDHGHGVQGAGHCGEAPDSRSTSQAPLALLGLGALAVSYAAIAALVRDRGSAVASVAALHRRNRCLLRSHRQRPGLPATSRPLRRHT